MREPEKERRKKEEEEEEEDESFFSCFATGTRGETKGKFLLKQKRNIEMEHEEELMRELGGCSPQFIEMFNGLDYFWVK